MKHIKPIFFLFIGSLCGGHFLIKYFGAFYSNEANGYRQGNRRRFITILQLNWTMLNLDLVIYKHLFSFFTTSSKIFELNKNKKHVKDLRFRWFCVYFMFLCFAHLAYFLYIIESFTVFWAIYYFSEICGGIWLHLFTFSVFFITLNFFSNLKFMHFEKIEQFISKKTYNRCAMISAFFCNPQTQVVLTFIFTFLLCSTHWYFSDKVFVKQLTIPLRKNISSTPAQLFLNQELKAVVLSDLHIGACVYEKQVKEIVRKVNELDAEVIFIIGDAIDAPKFLIEERVQALQNLRSKYGTFFVTGNHEYYYGNAEEWILLFKTYGIAPLRNQHIILKGVCIVGLDDLSSAYSGIYGHAMNVSAIKECNEGSPTVVLEHNPAGTTKILNFAKTYSHTIDLILSGHTHGGQYYIMVPYVLLFLPYFYGQYSIQTTRSSNLGETKLFVSAGTLYQGAPMKMPFMSEIWLLNLTF